MTEKCGLLTLKLQVYHFPRESASILSLDSLIRHVGRHKLGAWVFIPSQAARYSLVPLFQSESKCENDFDLHENENACRTHFHMKGFALMLS